MSKDLAAVLIIANNPLMGNRLLKIIDQHNETIHFDGASDGLSGSEKTLMSWAWCLWRGQSLPQELIEQGWRDPIEGFDSLDKDNKLSVIHALSVKYGIF